MTNELDGTHLDHASLQAAAKRHLWMHFTRLADFDDHELPIIVRGKGCEVFDQHGNRKLDALSGLFVVQAGHGRHDLAQAGAAQAETLEYFPIWSHAHPPAIELAAKLAALAPGDLNRVFFTSGGSEAVESAWKLARQYFRAIGEAQRYKVVSRRTAYHGTTFGALSITGVTGFRTPFEPLLPGGGNFVPNTNRYRHPLEKDDHAFMLWSTDAIEEAIVSEGPETVAAVFLEPVQNAGGCFVPPPGYFQRVREICDRHGVLLVSDEVICGYGRLGTMFGAERFGYVPDMITSAKGLTSGYSPLGAVLCRDFLAEPFLADSRSFTHGITFGGHPVSCAVALCNLQVFDDEALLANVTAHEGGFRERLEGLYDVPIVGDVRGTGYFWAVELVKDQATRERFTRPEVDELLRGFIAPELYDAGLICRTDDRGDPVLQFAPPLVSGDAELDEIEATVRRVLGEAARKVSR
jgi:adenosylmethionine-8-amino-7-oxononanoate aminotransferase